MKTTTVRNLCLAILVFSLLATPALGQNRSNKGGARRGDARADQVQASNKKQRGVPPIAATSLAARAKHFQPTESAG